MVFEKHPPPLKISGCTPESSARDKFKLYNTCIKKRYMKNCRKWLSSLQPFLIQLTVQKIENSSQYNPTELLFQNELRNRRRLFSKNGYRTSFFNRILEKLFTQNNGACNQDLNSSKTQKRKFFLTEPYSGKRQLLFSKICGF